MRWQHKRRRRRRIYSPPSEIIQRLFLGIANMNIPHDDKVQLALTFLEHSVPQVKKE